MDSMMMKSKTQRNEEAATFFCSTRGRCERTNESDFDHFFKESVLIEFEFLAKAAKKTLFHEWSIVEKKFLILQMFRQKNSKIGKKTFLSENLSEIF